MTREEIGKIIAVLMAAYPSHPVPNPDMLVTVWEMTMGDMPYRHVQAAVAHYLQQGGDSSYRGWPDISTIRRIISDAVLQLPDAAEAWRLVLERMHATYPGHPASDWDIPTALRRSVEAIGGIHALRMSENLGADQRRFVEVYRQYAERAIREADLPALAAAMDDRALGDRVPQLSTNGTGRR